MCFCVLGKHLEGLLFAQTSGLFRDGQRGLLMWSPLYSTFTKCRSLLRSNTSSDREILFLFFNIFIGV